MEAYVFQDTETGNHLLESGRDDRASGKAKERAKIKKELLL
jgi:hypothetical protein